jgi:hypothetical protein
MTKSHTLSVLVPLSLSHVKIWPPTAQCKGIYNLLIPGWYKV